MLSKYSVKKPYTVIVGIIMVIVLGVISFQNMTTDLLPSMDLPYVVVYTTYIGATPEQVEQSVTRPLESSFATLTDIKNISSNSMDNVSVVILEFNEGANMDTALIEIASDVDQIAGSWDDGIGAPVTMKLNPNMLPVAIMAVNKEDMDIIALSEYVEDELIPQFEAINGVASVTASGLIEQRVDIIIDPSRIDILNSAILAEVDEELAKVEQQLNDAQAQISDGKRQLSRTRKSTLQQIDDGLSSIESGSDQLQTAIAELTKQRDELLKQRESVQATITQLDSLVNMTDEQKAQLKLMEQSLAALKQQKAELEKQLESAGSVDQSALIQQRDEAKSQRDALDAERSALTSYVADLALLNEETLKMAIAQLESDIAQTQSSIDAANADLEKLNIQKAATEKEIADLKAQIEAMGGETTDQPTQAPTDTVAPTETAAPSDTPASTETVSPTETAAPSDTPAGTETVSPTETASPSDTPAGTETVTPTETAAPSDTPAGTETVSPTETSAPSDTPVSTETAAPAETAALTSAPDSTDAAVQATESATDVPEAESEAAPASVLNLLGLAAQADENTVEDLQTQLADAQKRLEQTQSDIKKTESELKILKSTLTRQNENLASKQKALESLQGGEDVKTRLEEANRQIASLNERIAKLDVEILKLDAQIAAGNENSVEVIKQALAVVNKGIEEIESSDAYQALALIKDPESLNSAYAQAQQGLAQIDAGLSQINGMLDKLNQGIIPGGLIEGIDEDTKLSDAENQLKEARKKAVSAFGDAQDQLQAAEQELETARAEFAAKRDEALKDAGLDGVITLEMISGILGAQNFAMPAGYVYDVENEQILVRVGDKFGSLDELRQMKLFDLGLESIDEVRLLDVASVEIVDNRDEVFTKLDGSDGVLLSFEKQSTYSTAEVAQSIIEKADNLTAADSSLHITNLMDQGEYITVIVDSVLDNLLSGGVLAVLILLLFLMDIRPTITVAFSIPISVVVAFVCMYFSGITLNVLSLSGLSLGIGMLVDNSIVAIENIYRLREEEHMPLLKSCVVGVQKVAGAMFSSTLTTICVFLPVVFVEGIARDLFADMGLTIAYSLIASLIVAMTVVPAMSSFLMKKSKPRKHNFFKKIQSGYLWILKGVLRFKPLVLLATVALLAFCVVQIGGMGISFMPEVNSTQMSATLALDPEMTVKDQQDLALNIMNDMMTVDGVASIGLMSGGSTSILSSGGAGSMSYYIIVDENSDRSNKAIAEEMTDIGEKYGADLSVQSSTMDISMMTGSGISINILGDDLEVLQSIARDVADIVAQVDGAVDIDNGLQESVPEMHIVVDKEKAIENGLTVAQVYQYVAQKLYGAVEITQITLDGRELSVYVMDGANASITPEDVENFEIEVTTGEKDKRVRIGDIAQVEDSTSLTAISRAAQRRQVTVSFGVADGYSANLVSNDLEKRLDAYQLPEGYDIALSGENEMVMGIMDDLILMIVVAIIMIFLIMVAQFQSFKSPIIVMFTIPLAFTGGMLALIMTGMDLSIVSMLGFLVLSGVVVNNGIVFIDCINQLRIEGYAKREAILEAGRQRLRPILMTALTTILGMSTMALGQGTGAEMMQPMAVVTIGGLTYSTLMTLFVVPVMYDLFNGEKLKAREVMMMKEAAGLNGDDVLENDSVEQGLQHKAGSEAKSGAAEVEKSLVPVNADAFKVPVAPEKPSASHGASAKTSPVADGTKKSQNIPAGEKAIKVRFKKK